MTQTAETYIEQYGLITSQIAELKGDLQRVQSVAGKDVLQQAIRQHDNEIITMRAATYVQVIEGANEGSVYQVLREDRYRGGLIYIIWESRSNPDEDYNWLDEEDVVRIKLPFQR